MFQFFDFLGGLFRSWFMHPDNIDKTADFWNKHTSINPNDLASLSNAGFGSSITNLLDGNLDYARELELLNRQQAFNSTEAEKERNWQESMRDSSYTSMINQLKANGLNPYLALGGGGATASSGASASSGGASHHSNSSSLSTLLSSLVGSATRMATAEMNKDASYDLAIISRNAKEYQANMLAKHRLEIARDRLDFDKERYYDYLYSKSKSKFYDKFNRKDKDDK